MARKKPTKKDKIAESLHHYQKVDDVINSLPTNPRLPKGYKNLSLEKKEQFVKMLKHLLHEFMDSYMLVGFSADGLETIIVENHGTPLETRGLNDLAFEFFNIYFSDSIGHRMMEDFDEDDDEDF